MVVEWFVQKEDLIRQTRHQQQYRTVDVEGNNTGILCILMGSPRKCTDVILVPVYSLHRVEDWDILSSQKLLNEQ